MAGSEEVLKQLVSLAHLDIDAVHTYTSAIERITLGGVKERLTEFRSDHERHVSELCAVIERLGGKAPEGRADLKGFFIQGFTVIRSMMGNEQALKAMKDNEELTNKMYDQALQVDFPADIKLLVQRNRDDERRHLEYITRTITEKLWEHPEKNVA